LTLPVIKAAAQVTFPISGQSKNNIVREILASDKAPANYPAAQVRPKNGRLRWFITADAAENLPHR
jgi:6-phosphogluconolactonase